MIYFHLLVWYVMHEINTSLTWTVPPIYTWAQNVWRPVWRFCTFVHWGSVPAHIMLLLFCCFVFFLLCLSDLNVYLQIWNKQVHLLITVVFFFQLLITQISQLISLNYFHYLGRKSLKLLKTPCRQFFQSLVFNILQVQATNNVPKQTNWFPIWKHNKCSKIKIKLITSGQIFSQFN